MRVTCQNNKAIYTTVCEEGRVQEIKGMKRVSEIVVLIEQNFKSMSVLFLDQHWTFEVVFEGAWLKPRP